MAHRNLGKESGKIPTGRAGREKPEKGARVNWAIRRTKKSIGIVPLRSTTEVHGNFWPKADERQCQIDCGATVGNWKFFLTKTDRWERGKKAPPPSGLGENFLVARDIRPLRSRAPKPPPPLAGQQVLPEGAPQEVTRPSQGGRGPRRGFSSGKLPGDMYKYTIPLAGRHTVQLEVVRTPSSFIYGQLVFRSQQI